MRTDEDYLTMRQFEEEVNEYLSLNWKLFKTGKAQFINDIDMQCSGIDISCDNGLYIDSKIKNTNEINQICDYPSVEITIKHNELSGWFINPKIKTHAYLYISVYSDKTDYHQIHAKDIKKLNCMIFSKVALKKYIQQYVSLHDIYVDALCLNEYQQRKNYYDKDGHKVFHLKYSPYKEGAVNLVFNREVYLGLSGTKEFEI